jgi:hypothetical protein
MRRKMRQLGSKRKNCRLLVDDLAYPERYRRGCYGRHPCCFIACCLSMFYLGLHEATTTTYVYI